MQLTPTQVKPFERDRYLFFPGLFGAAETRVDGLAANARQTSPDGIEGTSA